MGTTTTEEPTTTTEEETTTTTTTEEPTTTTEEETTTTTEEQTTTTEEQTTSTTTEETTSEAGRPGAEETDALKSGTLKEKVEAAVRRSFTNENRSGKVRKLRARLFGLSKKAPRRKDKRCKLTQIQRDTANAEMVNVTTVSEFKNAIFAMFDARTNNPPGCERINLFLKRKLNKIVRKINNQAPAA